MTKKRTFELSLILGLVFTFLLSLAGFDAKCANIEDNIFRLHIKANSNSDVDQQLKLKVRDNILELSEDLYEGANNKADAMNIASDNMDLILANAKNTIKDNGFDYSVSGEIKKSYFGTRVYENFTLPAGYYDSLKIYIGSGEGENWWCVLFPKVCLDACSDFDDSIDKNAEEIITNPKDYKVQFKVIEIYNQAKEKINSIFLK